jgi:hypothetical protein
LQVDVEVRWGGGEEEVPARCEGRTSFSKTKQNSRK